MLHCTCKQSNMLRDLSLRYIFRSFSLPLVIFVLFLVFSFLSLFSFVFGFNFFCLFLLAMVNVFGALISEVSCILANN